MSQSTCESASNGEQVVVEEANQTEAPVKVAPSGNPDPFDPARLRLTQDFAATAGVKKVIVNIPVRKPAREWFVQVHPDPGFRIETATLELREDRELFLVDPSLWGLLSNESTFGARQLLAAISRQGTLFIWPIRLPASDGKLDDWNRSALEAAKRATGRWVRVTANLTAGSYDVFEAPAHLAAPEWPELSFREMLRIGFKDKLIESADHPVLKRLRGEL